MSVFKRNKLLNKYKVTRSAEWCYKNAQGTYSTELIIIEDKIIFEDAVGKPNLEDTKIALKIVKNIISLHFKDSKPHYVSDTRNIQGADAEVRKYVAEFHKNNRVFESISLIANTFTRALFSIVKNLGIGNFKGWTIYRNETYCIDEILQGEVIIGQSQEGTDYDFIYKALGDLRENKLSYSRIINKTKNNEQLNSIIHAIQIITEEQKQTQLDPLGHSMGQDNESINIMFKSVLENTDTVVALMDEKFRMINVNANFNTFFNIETVESENLSHFLDIEEVHFRNLELENHTQFFCSHASKTLSCKLYKIENLVGGTCIIFMSEDITEKENLKVSEQKLLSDWEQQNFKLVKVNHILSHEINHQIASLSQILNECRVSISRDPNVEKMIAKVQQDLHASLASVNNILFDSNKDGIKSPATIQTISQSDQLKILLIDDDEITNLLNEKILSNNLPNCEFKVLMEGQKALSILEKEEFLPDIILLDLYMPEMDGFEFLKKMNNLKLPFSPKIFVLSSSRDPEEIALVNSFNKVKGYFSKPLSNTIVQVILESYRLG